MNVLSRLRSIVSLILIGSFLLSPFSVFAQEATPAPEPTPANSETDATPSTDVPAVLRDPASPKPDTDSIEPKEVPPQDKQTPPPSAPLTSSDYPYEYQRQAVNTPCKSTPTNQPARSRFCIRSKFPQAEKESSRHSHSATTAAVRKK